MWNCGNWGAGLPFGFGSFLMGLGPFGGLLGVLLIIFLMYLGIRLIMSFIPKANATPDKEDSLEILKRRLAAGKITQEEYHRMREILFS